MKIDVGTAYYPEVWTKEEIREDALRMKKIGVNSIRIGEFAWSHLEPTEGNFTFDWLLEAIDVFGKEGINTVLCTPSSAAPAWMCKEYPQVLRVMRDQITRAWFGVRDHTCYTNQIYRDFCCRIAKKMAEAVKDNPYVVAWQIDNEPGCSRFSDCFCPECQAKFRKFVKDRYKTIAEVNRVWGTTFWSGEFSSFDEIELENRWENMASSRTLDSRRFRSREQADFILLQAQEIRKVIPDAQIGTNNYVIADRYQVFDGLDFAGNDLYPRFADDYTTQRYCLDLYRGLKVGVRPWMLETNTAPDWPRHDLTELYYWLFIGHGYDHIYYFNWNNHPAGNEKEHLTIICPTGVPGEKYEQLGKMISSARALDGEKILPLPETDSALVNDYDQSWIYSLGKADRFGFNECWLRDCHNALLDASCTPEVVSSDVDYSRYKLLVLPAYPHMTVSYAEKLKKFVSEGGVLLMNGRIGMFDEWAKNIKVEGPEHLNDLAGLKVAENMPIWASSGIPEYDGKGEKSVQTVVSGILGGKKAEGTIGLWTGTIVPDADTEVLMRFSNSVLAGRPFLTCHKYGKGSVLYFVADAVDTALLHDIISYAAALAGIPNYNLPRGLDACRRGDLVFLTNFNDFEVSFPSPWTAENVMGDALKGGSITVPAYRNAILRIR
ncbi:MAG: beta-galactosidase [Lentisphaeria bacterium]|nr:beta-galactosidase [Lentisphaeria bacterium]